MLPEMEARRHRGVVYGPVTSRRLGRSLGLNLIPAGTKCCPFDCVYCEVGMAPPKLERDPANYPSADEVLAAVEAALPCCDRLEAITFSGAGEPTLHPAFRAIAEGVVCLRDRYAPNARVVVLSNGALAHCPDVRAGLTAVDLRLMKLDAGDPGTFAAINRPHAEITFTRIVDNLRQLSDITLQTLFVNGVVSNFTPEAQRAYMATVTLVQPRAVQLYTLHRPAPVRHLYPVPSEDLHAFAQILERLTGIETTAY